MTEERVGIRWARWVVRLAVVLVLLVVALAVGVHTPPVRQYALRRAIASLPDTVSLQADDLDYNLFALRATLRGVRVSAPATPDEPFFVARVVSVTLQGGLIARAFSDFRLQPDDRIEIDTGRARIIRTADGRLNLPASAGGDDEPEPLRLGTVSAPRFAFEFTDQLNQLALALPATDITIRENDGRIELRQAGRLSRQGTSTTIHDLNGGLGFDGRNVTLANVRTRLDEARVTVNGTVRVFVEEPGLDLHLVGEGDVARLARWGELDEAPRGDVTFDARVAGPFDALAVQFTGRVPTLQWRDVVATNVDTAVRVTSDRLFIDRADAEAYGGRVTAGGEVPLGPGDTRFAASWADVDLERLMQTFARGVSPRPTGRATGTLTARGPGTDLQRWTVDATTRTIEGVTGRNRIALGGTVSLHVADGRWRVRADQRVGGVPTQAALRGLLNPDRLDRSTVSGTITLPPIATRAVLDLLRRTDIATIRVPPTDGTIRAEATVTGTVGSPATVVTGEATLDDVAAFAPDTPLGGPVDVQFEATTREARMRATLGDFNAQVDATIQARAPYNADVVIEAPGLDLERLLRGLRTPVPVTGTAAATIRATLPLEEWRRGRADIDITALNARAGALPVRLAAPAQLSYEHEILGVRSLEILAGDTRLSAFGGLLTASSVDGGPAMQVTAVGDLAQFTSAIAATGMVDMPDVSGTGPAALLARVTGSLEDPHVIADLELGPGTLRSGDVPPATGVQLRAHSDGEWIEIRELTAEWQGSRVEATGRAPVDWAITRRNAPSGASLPEATLRARIASITPQVLAPFLDPDTIAQIEGSVDATVRLGSTAPDLDAVTGEVQLDRMDVRIADLPIAQRVPTRIALESGFARVAAWEWTGQGGTLAVRGRVRLADQQAALLATGRFDLRMLTPFVRDAGMTTAGAVEPRLSITGALTGPRLDGDVTVSGGEIRLLDPRVIASGVAARAVLTRTTAHLTQLSGSVNGGRLSGTGTIEFAPRTPLDATLSLSVDGMALEFPEGLRSELNAALGINITVPAADVVTPSGSITGTVTVLRGAYREPTAVVAGLLTALRTRRVAADVAAEPSLIDHLALDVRVITEDDVVVDNNLGRLQLGTDVRVIGTVAAPSLAGRAQLREGGRLFLGRNIYVIDSGAIDFVNPDAIEPDLNIRAHTQAGGEEIELTIKGPLDHLDRTLRSPTAPELGEADLYSLLVTGRLLEDVAGDEAEIVGEQVLGFLSGDVLGMASRAVGLDTIRLGGVEQEILRRDPTAIATELDPNTRLTFGKSIGRSVDLTYSQSLRDADAQAWIVDYRPFRAVELRLVSDDENLRSYEFRHDVSIGGGALPTAQSRERAPQRGRELRVTALTVRGSEPLSQRRIESALQLGVGDRFDFADWQRDREHLEALYRREGRFEARIDAQRVEADNGVALTYEITAGPRTVIQVSGPSLPGATLERISTAWSQSVLDPFLIDEVRGIVTRDLAGRGYLQPRVDVAFRMAPEGTEKTLVITIDPGPRVTSERVTIDVPDEALERELLAHIDQRKLTPMAAREPAALERELTMHLRTRGYLGARVGVGAPIIDGSGATVRIEVQPGAVFTIADVRFVGAAQLPIDTVRSVTALAPGEPFDPAAVDRARERLAARYRREGFPRSRVEIAQVPNEETSTVTVTFAIDEGPRQVIAEIAVQGNRAIDEDVITRALNLPLNQPLATDEWLQARRRLFDTGLFRRVDLAAEPVASTAPVDDTQPMRARVTVQEWPALRLRYGFEVAEERPEGELEGRDLVPGLSADLTRRTIFGRAVNVGTALQYQRRERSGRAFINAPTLLGWPIESSLLLQRSRETFTAATLVTDRSGLSWEQRMRFARNLRLSYAYRFSRDHTFDTQPDPDRPVFDLTVRVARLTAAAAFDTRDDPVDARRGMLLSSSFEYAPAMLGSEFRFAKQLAQAYYFRPWRGVVFASAGRFGLAGALDDQRLILSERFRAGGSRTVRGAVEEGLGPRDFFGPTGGEAVLVLNQEVRFPIYRRVRGVGFLDAGNVFASRSDVALGDLVGSGGFGLRFDTPFALLRVDYGRLFSRGTDGRSGRWYFGIGQAF